MPYLYTKCPLCGFVEELGNNDDPCSNCKKPANNESENTEEWRTAWPSPSEWKYLNMIVATWKDIRNRHAEDNKELEEQYKKIVEWSSKIPKVDFADLKLNLEKFYDPVNESDEMYQSMYRIIMEKFGKNVPTINLIAENILVGFLSDKTREIYDENFIVIITCTFIETLLDRLLIDILIKKETSEEIATSLIKEIKSIPSKMSLFKRLTGQKLSAVLKQSTFQDYAENWRYLREDKRNEFIHGNPHTIKEDDAKKSYQIGMDSVKVFAYLHNKFCVKNI